MQNSNFKTKLKKAYKDIVLGFSEYSSKYFTHFFVKHLSDFDTSVLEDKGQQFSDYAKNKGLPSEKERLEYLKKVELWGEKEDIDLKEQVDFLSNIKTSKTKTLIPSQLQAFNDAIKDTEKKIAEMKYKRDELIGKTIEKYTNRKINEYYIFYSSYKDNQFKEQVLSEKELDELDDEQLIEMYDIFARYNDNFSTLNLKRITLCSFFLNSFYLCDNDAFKFYGKPISQITLNQIELFHNGCYFKRILSECQGIEITDEILENPDKLLETHTLKQNIEKEIQKSAETEGEGGIVSIVGAKAKDLGELGFGVTNLNKKFAESAKGKGGKLRLEEMMAVEEGKPI